MFSFLSVILTTTERHNTKYFFFFKQIFQACSDSISAVAAANSALRKELSVAVALPSPTTSTVTVTIGACDGPFTESTVYTGFREGFIDCDMT